MLIADVLPTIRTLYRQPDTLSLWGIPYVMREGQTPRDIWNAPRPDLLAQAAGRYGATMHAPASSVGSAAPDTASGKMAEISPVAASKRRSELSRSPGRTNFVLSSTGLPSGSAHSPRRLMCRARPKLFVHMEQNKFWPSVWLVSDHGNAHLMTESK